MDQRRESEEPKEPDRIFRHVRVLADPEGET
jgi:hypothetical protein